MMYMTTPSYKEMVATIVEDTAVTKRDLEEIILYAMECDDIFTAINEYYIDGAYPFVEDYDRAYDEYRDDNL